ncbi:MAG: NTP transferase domain-containing protein [Candidatus Eisenbacteria bacterium]|nr:NTP transferase domain-containing protein [Candidatus Eisenbacteria bacterium]
MGAMRTAVILAGGWGERLWPLSTRERPKQLLDVDGGGTLVSRTVRRVEPLLDLERGLVLTGESLRATILPELSPIPEGRVIGEPAGRNTAPAIALAAHVLSRENPDSVMVVLPADHLIGDAASFRETLEIAIGAAEKHDALVTLGIRPTRPETEYGYIRAGEAAAPDVRRVDSFVEKPDAETAALYLADGSYLWNSGMFIWRAERILRETAKYLPDVSDALDLVTGEPGGDEFRSSIAEYYDSVPSVSIDYGVMEKADDVVVVPATFDWDDVGAWSALERVWEQDSMGNATEGDVLLVDSRNNVVCSDGNVVAVLGMTDVVVVSTGQGTLVCPKDRARDVREVVAELRLRHERRRS